jgi:hypothetical protein
LGTSAAAWVLVLLLLLPAQSFQPVWGRVFKNELGHQSLQM